MHTTAFLFVPTRNVESKTCLGLQQEQICWSRGFSRWAGRDDL